MKLRAEAGKILEEARERQGLSRSALAQRTKQLGREVHEATIFNIERGEVKAPYPRKIYALCDALDLDPAQVFEVEGAA